MTCQCSPLLVATLPPQWGVHLSENFTHINTFWRLMSIFDINTNSTRPRIQLSVTKFSNPLLPININLQLVVLKLLVMFSLSPHKSHPIQGISQWLFLTANSHVIDSYLVSRPNGQHESFEYSLSIFFSAPEGKDTLPSIVSKILITFLYKFPFRTKVADIIQWYRNVNVWIAFAQ